MFLKIIKIFLTFFLVQSTLTTSSIVNNTKFNNWLENFKIKINDKLHLLHVFENWSENEKFIEEHNFKNLSFVLSHNRYSGFNSKEFSQFMGFENNKKYLRQTDNFFYNNSQSLPTSVDWREKGMVTPAKDQGQCGSCWSFSTTGALEGIYAINYDLVSFSEQQLVDCDNRKNGGKDMGCNGGLMDNAFEWITKNNGLCSENDYPYISGTTKTEQTCQKTCTNIKNSNIQSYYDVPVSDNDMMAALAKQPVSIAIEADQKAFQLYSSGIFTGTCGTNLDHGVLLVGYNTDYYILKNSWGSSWGENGFMKIGKGNDPSTNKLYNNGNGQCGLLMSASYPILKN
jgi:C1A family cysteine protease